MKKNIVQIGDYLISKVDENEYQYTNASQELEFHFVVDEPDDIIVFVFDSLIPNNSPDEGFLGAFNASSLEEAVSDIPHLTKDNLKDCVMWS